MKKFFQLFLVSILFAAPGFAAQLGTIVVDEATVHEFPQEGSKVISTLSKDQSMAVSNLPTEGFYKVRLSTGELGWVSGNDVFVGKTAPRLPEAGAPDAQAPQASRMANPMIPQARPLPGRNPRPKIAKKQKTEEDEAEVDPDTFSGDETRLLLMVGIQSPSYAGLASYVDLTGLSPNYGLVLEYQTKISKRLHWVGRAEFDFASVAARVLPSGVTQTLKQSSIPLMLGLQFSPVTNPDFRLGIGAYLGLVMASGLTVIQSNATVEETVPYGSTDPVGMLNTQISYSLGRHIAMVGEVGYRYQKSGQFRATTSLGSVPALTIDYSGMILHLGLEFKF